MTDIQLIRTPSLGDNSYLLASGDEAAIVDPQRDVWPVLRACRQRGLTLRYVLETHVHNDYVSGAQEARAATGARVVAPARGRYTFDHLPVVEGDEIVLGDLAVRVMETPGHTPEHVSYLVVDDRRPAAVFTGGSLIAGSAGRTDLLGTEAANDLTRAQFRSLRRLAALPETTGVLPTHGAGSFCARSAASGSPTSTIGAERRTNPALLITDEERFVRERLTGLPRFPAYYRHMAPINRAGARVLRRAPALRALTPDQVARLSTREGWVVDARDRRSFAAEHVPGSINDELDFGFASYLGWIVPFGAPVALVLPEPVAESAREAVVQLLRIGYDRVAGYLDGGIDAWLASGRKVRSYPVADIGRLAAQDGRIDVLDVRQPFEVEQGRIPGSTHVFVGDLAANLPHPRPGREVWTVCASGRRAAIAASLLDRAGIPVTAVTSGGVPDYQEVPT